MTVISQQKRIRRGFSRFGIILAALFLLPMSADITKGFKDLSEASILLTLVGIAVVIWAVFYAVGWAISGFAKD